MTGPGIGHVLLDADGVLQHRPGGWERAFEEWAGARSGALLEEMFTAEQAAIRGERDAVEVVAEVLARFDVEADPALVFEEVWHRIEPVPASLDLVRRLRAAGLGVHLGTNQSRRRAAYMRHGLGYDDLFDVSCYSAELGVAKPDPAYFRAAARLIGVPPGSVVFVDDVEPNVEAARATGMAGVHWHLRDGHAVLERMLAEHGVVAATT
jgi:putative hydrolase of the HAD superfamily